MKFKAYKTEHGDEIPTSIITDADPVYLLLKVTDRCGHLEWEIKGRMQGAVIASSAKGYNLEISTY